MQHLQGKPPRRLKVNSADTPVNQLNQTTGQSALIALLFSSSDTVETCRPRTAEARGAGVHTLEGILVAIVNGALGAGMQIKKYLFGRGE